MKRRPVLWSFQWMGALVLAGVILLLLTVLLPAIQQARESARRTQSKNILKLLGHALHTYHDNSNMFPPGGVFAENGRHLNGWMASLTPFMDVSPWYNETNFSLPWDDPQQIRHFHSGFSRGFDNPSIPRLCTDDGLLVSHFAGNDVIFYHNSSTGLSHLTNGASQTLFVGDAAGEYEPFGSTYHWRSVDLGLNASPHGFGCPVREITQILMADGTVRELSHLTDAKVFASLKGENSKWADSPGDISKPSESNRLKPPYALLWADTSTCCSLLGVQDEAGELEQAIFLNPVRDRSHLRSYLADKQVHLLKEHRSLRTVDADDALSDAGIQILESLPNLESLSLDGLYMSRRGFNSILRCKQMKRLKLVWSGMRDADWKSLPALSRLEAVTLDYRAETPLFSFTSVAEFKAQNPSCEVHLYDGTRRGK